jgi:hypothetical protein
MELMMNKIVFGFIVFAAFSNFVMAHDLEQQKIIQTVNERLTGSADYSLTAMKKVGKL